MRLMRSTIETCVIGSVACVPIAPGTVVDVDRVVGQQDGRDLTLGEALGDRLHHFAPVARESVTTARGRRGKPIDQPATPGEE